MSASVALNLLFASHLHDIFTYAIHATVVSILKELINFYSCLTFQQKQLQTKSI